MAKKGEKMSPEMKAKLAEGRRKAQERREAIAKAQANATPVNLAATEVTSVLPSPEPQPQPAPEVFASKGAQPEHPPMGKEELAEIMNEKSELEAMVGGVSVDGSAQDAGFTNTADLSYARRRLAQIDDVLARRMQEDPKAVRKDYLHKEIKDLEGVIRHGMLSFNEYFPTTTQMRDNAGMVGLGMQNLNWETQVLPDGETRKQKILRWKDLRRQLDPERAQSDPNWTNVEVLRPGRPITTGMGGLQQDKIQSTGWDPPGLTETEQQIRILRNLSPEIVAQNFGVSVEEVLRIQGKLEVASA
jgi:hypothetical protein